MKLTFALLALFASSQLLADGFDTYPTAVDDVDLYPTNGGPGGGAPGAGVVVGTGPNPAWNISGTQGGLAKGGSSFSVAKSTYEGGGVGSAKKSAPYVLRQNGFKDSLEDIILEDADLVDGEGKATFSRCWLNQRHGNRWYRRTCRTAWSWRAALARYFWGYWLWHNANSNTGTNTNNTEDDDNDDDVGEAFSFATHCGVTCDYISEEFDERCEADGEDPGPTWADSGQASECVISCEGDTCGFGKKYQSL